MDDSESVTVLWGLAHRGTCEGLLGSAGPPLLPTGGTAAGHIQAQATQLPTSSPLSLRRHQPAPEDMPFPPEAVQPVEQV